MSWGDPIDAYSFHTLLRDRKQDVQEFSLLNTLNAEMKEVCIKAKQKYFLDVSKGKNKFPSFQCRLCGTKFPLDSAV